MWRAPQCKPRQVAEIKIAVDFAGQAAPVCEVQQLEVFDLVDDRRVVNGHLLVVAVIIGQGHE